MKKEIRDLTSELEVFHDSITKMSKHGGSFLKEFVSFSKTFKDAVKKWTAGPPVPGGGGPGGPPGPGGPGGPGGGGSGGKGGKGGDDDGPMAKWISAAKSMEPLMRRAFATGADTGLSMKQYLTSVNLGISVDQLAEEMLAFREEGVNNLNESTLKLIGRMKLSDQSTQSLIKFVSVNSTTLLQNQKQGQDLAFQIADFAKVMGTRQDDMLNLAGAISQSMDTRAALGTGADLTQALTNFGSTLGAAKSGLVDQLAKFMGDTSKTTALLNLGMDRFEDAITSQTSPEGQAQAVKEMIMQAGGQLENVISNLGTGPMAAKMAESMLTPYGGKQALALIQLKKALEDQKEPLNKTADAMNTFSTFGDALVNPLKMAVVYLGQLLNIIPTKLLVGFGNLIGALLAVKTITTALNVTMGISNQLAKFNSSMGGGGKFGKFLAFLGPVAMLLGVAIDILGETSKDTKELNEKTVDQHKQENLNKSSMLSGYILSQLSNIALAQNRGSADREMLENSKELVRLARRSLDVSDPQKGLPSTSMRPNR
jgi:hypothetical protein